MALLMAAIGNATEETLLTLTGARPIGPTAAVAFTAADPAVPLASAATAYAAGFVIVNQSGATMWIGPTGVAAATGRPLASGGQMVINASDASKWYAFAVAASSGIILGTVGG